MLRFGQRSNEQMSCNPLFSKRRNHAGLYRTLATKPMATIRRINPVVWLTPSFSVPIKKLIAPDCVICVEGSKKVRMLKWSHY